MPNDKPPKNDPEDIPEELLDEIEDEVFGIQEMAAEEGIDRMTRRIEYLKKEVFVCISTIENVGNMPVIVDRLMADIGNMQAEIHDAQARAREYQHQKEGRN